MQTNAFNPMPMQTSQAKKFLDELRTTTRIETLI